MQINHKRKKEDFKRPKSYFTKDGTISHFNFKIFINNFMDLYSWSNNKYRFYHKRPYFTRYDNTLHQQGTKTFLNKMLAQKTPIIIKGGSKIEIDGSNKFSIKMVDVKAHLNSTDKSDYLFYVNSCYSRFPMMLFDIDVNDSTTPQDLQNACDFLLTLHPDSYYETSTNGLGLHFYVLFDFSDNELVSDKNFFKNNRLDTSAINNYIRDYSFLLRCYINTFFNVKFDDVKATYSQYSKDKDLDALQIVNCGNHSKLPLPRSSQDCSILYSMPFTTFDIIDTNSSLLLSYILSIYSYLFSDSPTSLSFLSGFTSHPKYLLTTPDKKRFDRLILPHITYYLPHTTSTRNLLEEKQPFQSKNEDENIIYDSRDTDSMERERDYILLYIRDYYKNYNEHDSIDNCYNNYLSDSGYNKIDDRRKERFVETYEYTIRTFNVEKLGIRFNRGSYYISDLKNMMSKDELKEIQTRLYPEYRGRIKYEDIALASEFYYCSLTKLLSDKQKDFRSFTVAQNNMIQWVAELYKKHQTARTIDVKKVKMLRLILIDIAWLRCIDESYYHPDKGSKGVPYSRRHLLTKKHPKYNLFRKIIGDKILGKWENWEKENNLIA